MFYYVNIACYHGAIRSAGSNGRSIDARRLHAPWTTDRDKKHVRFKMDYNGPDLNARYTSGPLDRDPRSEIEAFL